MNMRLCRILMALVAVSCLECAVQAQDQWGNLSGTFVYDGKAPAPEKISVTKDVEVCGKHNLFVESLLVNPDNRGIQDVVVFLYMRSGKPPIHPSLAGLAKEKVSLDNHNCRFEPHVAVVETGQTLVIGNKDPIGHNTKVDPFKNTAINPTIPAGGEYATKFTEEESVPVAVSCSIHPWMKAWVVVKDHPYVAVTDKDGKFEIKNLPAGEWTFQFWHEKAGYLRDVTVSGGKKTGRRGQVDVKIENGKTTDLGQIKVPSAAFNKT